MSMFFSRFLCNADRFLSVEGEDPPAIQFHPHGYLLFASPEKADLLGEDCLTQLENDDRMELMTPTRLRERFPLINTDAVALAATDRRTRAGSTRTRCYSLSDEKPFS